MPVGVLAFEAPGNLQGFTPTLSHALSAALAEVSPPIREIPTDDMLNRLTDRGLAGDTPNCAQVSRAMEYWIGIDCGGLGSDLACNTCCCRDFAQFNEEIMDKFEAAGIKLLRNRVTTLRIWLQLWDTQTGHIVWESPGEVTVATAFLSPKQTVALEQIAKKLLVRMIQDELLESKTETQVVQDH